MLIVLEFGGKYSNKVTLRIGEDLNSTNVLFDKKITLGDPSILLGDSNKFIDQLQKYLNSLPSNQLLGLEARKDKTTYSHREVTDNYEKLTVDLGNWIAPIFGKILEYLQRNERNSQEKHLIIRSDNFDIHKLPWESCDFFRQNWTSLSLGHSSTYNIEKIKRNKIRILAIIPQEEGTNNLVDKSFLQEIFYDVAELEIPESLSRNGIIEALQDEQGWDIFIFSGHGKPGDIQINKNIFIETKYLQKALERARNNGLHLVIFNCM